MNFRQTFASAILIMLLPSVASASMNIIKSLYIADFESLEETAEQRFFKLEGELGLLTSSGNANTVSIKAGFDAEHEMESWSNQYRFETLYRESETNTSDREVSAQRIYTNAQFDFKLKNPDQRLFLFGEYDNNRFGAYDYQGAVAAGWAQKAINKADHQLRYSVGPGYGFAVRHDGEVDEENHGFILRASMEYKYKLSTGAKLRQFISAEANDFSTRSRSETSLSTHVMDSLAMKLSFIMNYNSGADDAKKSLDTETSIALVYQFF